MSTIAFEVGDAVHVTALGKGIVREVRNGDRYLVEIKGRALVATGSQLTAIAPAKPAARPKGSPSRAQRPPVYEPRPAAVSSIDLHGLTVDEGLDAVIAFLNTALLTGSSEVRIIHGRSGGKLRGAVHAQLKQTASIRSFALDPSNAGVTIVRL